MKLSKDSSCHPDSYEDGNSTENEQLETPSLLDGNHYPDICKDDGFFIGFEQSGSPSLLDGNHYPDICKDDGLFIGVERFGSPCSVKIERVDFRGSCDSNFLGQPAFGYNENEQTETPASFKTERVNFRESDDLNLVEQKHTPIFPDPPFLSRRGNRMDNSNDARSDLKQNRSSQNTVYGQSNSDLATVVNRTVFFEYIYGILGLVLGLASIIGGVILGLNGVAGSTSWTASLLGLKSNINDAAPGVVLFIIGVFLVWITKPKIHMKDIKG